MRCFALVLCLLGLNLAPAYGADLAGTVQAYVDGIVHRQGMGPVTAVVRAE